MKIYISGPMTGLPEYNHPLFNRVAADLRAMGYEVINPAEIVLKDIPKDYVPLHEIDAKRVWEAYMKECLKLLMDANVIAYLPGWRKSKGARIEMFTAEEVGIMSIDYKEIVS